MNPDSKLDLDMIDTVTYAMGKTLDHLGNEGQILLDKVGEEIVNYLAERGEIKRTKDPFRMITRLDKYFAKQGYVAKRKVRFEKDEIIFELIPSSWTFSDTWRKLRNVASNSQCTLISCPLCLANDSMLRNAGFGLRFISHIEERGKIISRSKVVDLETRQLIKKAFPTLAKRRIKYAFGAARSERS